MDYRLADLIGRISNKERKQVLRDSQNAYERFLRRMDEYDILNTADKKLYESYTENPSTFSTIPTSDPAARRAAKITNYKHEKELKAKLDVRATRKCDFQV